MNKNLYATPIESFDTPATALAKLPPTSLVAASPYLPDHQRNRSPRQLSRAYKSAEETEHYRAALSQTAMGHAGQLSMMADAISEAVPSAEQPVRTIVQGYALSAAARIMKF
jgi:hypothetical protein